jgi:hypothetical protein
VGVVERNRGIGFRHVAVKRGCTIHATEKKVSLEFKDRHVDKWYFLSSPLPLV